jgi:SAM-dependent methyltransferase
MKYPLWNERYSEPGFAYGVEPNEFLVSAANRIPMGKVLSLGEGEGRNAVYLAGLGYDVTAVDSSDVGLTKARELAAKRGVTITTITADLSQFRIEPKSWDGIFSIFCHLPREIRRPLYRSAVDGLRPGGVLVLEAFTPLQLRYGTGGPSEPDRLLSLEDARSELTGLEFAVAEEKERQVREGKYHTGLASVVQIFGIRA